MKSKTEAHLCMEAILLELFGAAHAEFHITQPDYLARWQKRTRTKTGKIRKLSVWRHDYAVPYGDHKLAVEIEGLGKGHQGTAGFLANIPKYNESAVQGFSLLRFTVQMVKDGRARATLQAWKRARA